MGTIITALLISAALMADTVGDTTPIPIPEPRPKRPGEAEVPAQQLEIEACWRKHFLDASKRKVAADFNWNGMTGQCAGAVQAMLGEAGFLPPKYPKPEEPFKGNLGYWFGNAIDFHDRSPTPRQQDENGQLKNQAPGFGVLHELGFRNLIATYPDDRRCLPGTILVYEATSKKAETYQEKGTVGKPSGDSVGHITVCGEEQDKDGLTVRYYTDGRTEFPTVDGPESGKRRRLVGVYTMTDCKECHPAYKKICQKIPRTQEYE